MRGRSGTYYWGEGGEIPAVMHWDGTSWNRLAAPFAEGGLTAVFAVSAHDVWASGNGGMWHWDGKAWSQFDIDTRAWAVATASSDDVWAVAGGPPQFAHWDGQSWAAVKSPPLRDGGRIVDLVALSKNDVWAVGYRHPTRTLIEHWDGRTWSVVPCPHAYHVLFDMLTAVDASSSDDVWAVGVFGKDDGYPYHGHRFMLHWDGTAWTRYRH